MLATALLASFGCATPSNWERGPAYVAAGAAYAFEGFDLDDAEEDSGLELEADGAAGGELRVGLRVHPLAELELQGQAFDVFEVEASDGTTDEVELGALTLNLKLYEPRSWFPDLSARWLPYLVLGLGVVQGEVDDSAGFLGNFEETAPAGRAGLGLEVFVSDSLAWYLEGSVLEPFDELAGLTLLTLSAGLQWRF